MHFKGLRETSKYTCKEKSKIVDLMKSSKERIKRDLRNLFKVYLAKYYSVNTAQQSPFWKMRELLKQLTAGKYLVN